MNPNLTNFLIFILITLMLMSFDGAKDKFIFDDLSFSEKEIEVYNIENLNSKGLDFCAVPYRKGIVFTSSRNKIDGSGLKNMINNNYFDLYFSEKIGDDIYRDPKKLRGKINGDLHDGTATFNQVGDMMYFTRNNEKMKGLVSLKFTLPKESKEIGSISKNYLSIVRNFLLATLHFLMMERPYILLLIVQEDMEVWIFINLFLLMENGEKHKI